MRRETLIIGGSMLLAVVAAIAVAQTIGGPWSAGSVHRQGDYTLQVGCWSNPKLAGSHPARWRVSVTDLAGTVSVFEPVRGECLSVNMRTQASAVVELIERDHYSPAGIMVSHEQKQPGGPTPTPTATPTPTGTPTIAPTPTSTPRPTPTPPSGEIALAGLEWIGDASYGKTPSGTIFTDSTATNILWACQIDAGAGDYTGAMRIMDAGGGAGVGVLYRDGNAQRLRQFSGTNIHVSPISGPPIPGCNLDTGVRMVAGEWTWFKVGVSYEGNCTRYRAMAWPESGQQPADWQVDCLDCSVGAAKTGAVVAWSAGPGRKEWKALTHWPATVPAPPTPTPVPTPTPLPDECHAFDTDGDGDVDLADYAGFVECFSGPR